MKILIIDDEPEIGSVMTEWFQSLGYSADAVSSLKCLPEADYDLVLLDIIMPDANGLSCIKMLRERFPQAKIIVVSAIADISLAVTACREGASGCLAKPLDLAKLRRIVQETACA